MKLYLPVNLDLGQLKADYPTAIPNSIDKCAYICSLILMSKQFNKDRFEDEYVPLHSSKLQDVIGDYKACLDYLEQSGVIAIDHQYIVDEKCKGYRLTHKYKTIAVPFIHIEPRFRRKLKRHEIARNGYTAHLEYITKWLNNDLQLNQDLVDEWINLNHDVKTTFPDLRDYNHIKKRYKCPIEQYKFSKLVAQRFKNDDFSHGQDNNVYRLHTNLTNMPSMMRNALTYKGQQLVSIDISNSQPYLAILLLTNSFRLKRTNKPKTALQIDFGKKLQETIATFKQQEEPSSKSQQNLLSVGADSFFLFNKEVNNCSKIDIKEIDNEDRLNIKDIKLNDKSSYIMLLKQSVKPINSDVINYINLVSTGKFYEYLMQLFTQELGEGYNDRTTVKVEVLKLFFTANGFLYQPKAKAKKVFKDHFPTVYHIFRAIKKNDKADLAKLLQSIESYLIIDAIAKRIARELPYAPIYTIHDSIATTIEYRDAVKKIMLEELENKIGIAPHLKEEYWQESNIHKSMQDLKNKVSHTG